MLNRDELDDILEDINVLEANALAAQVAGDEPAYLELQDQANALRKKAARWQAVTEAE